MPTRRHALALLAATPFAAVLRARGPDAASSWRDPGAGLADPRRFALAHAILTPNPHNTQPWQVAFDGDTGMTLYCDLERRLPLSPIRTTVRSRWAAVAFLELYRVAALEHWAVRGDHAVSRGRADAAVGRAADRACDVLAGGERGARSAVRFIT